MNNYKENTDPNRPYKNSISSYSKRSHAPKVSKFQGMDKQWRNKIMMPSQREKELQVKLANMLQRSNKESLKTNLTEDRYISSFISSDNYTLHKYCLQNPNLQEKDVNNSRKTQLVEIWQLSQAIAFNFKASKVQNFSEDDLLHMIKKALTAVINK